MTNDVKAPTASSKMGKKDFENGVGGLVLRDKNMTLEKGDSRLPAAHLECRAYLSDDVFYRLQLLLNLNHHPTTIRLF